VEKAHTADGWILCAFAYLIKKDFEKASALAEKIEGADSANFFLFLLKNLLQESR